MNDLAGTAQKMKFSIKDLFSECDQIRSLLKKSLMENIIFCVARGLSCGARDRRKVCKVSYLWDLVGRCGQRGFKVIILRRSEEGGMSQEEDPFLWGELTPLYTNCFFETLLKSCQVL